MAINPITSHTQSPSILEKAQTQATQKAEQIQPQKAHEIAGEPESPSADPKRFDRYEKSGENPASDAPGIYSVGQDENGNPKILFDQPEQTDKSAQESSKPEDASKSSGDKKPADTKTTVNTDKVDSEIRKLKEEQQEIQRQLQSEEDPNKRQMLEQKLKNIDSKLQTEDSDAYRKAHADFTTG